MGDGILGGHILLLRLPQIRSMTKSLTCEVKPSPQLLHQAASEGHSEQHQLGVFRLLAVTFPFVLRPTPSPSVPPFSGTWVMGTVSEDGQEWGQLLQNAV